MACAGAQEEAARGGGGAQSQDRPHHVEDHTGNVFLFCARSVADFFDF